MFDKGFQHRDREIQREQRRIDELDGKSDNKVDLPPEEEKNTKTYIQGVNRLQGRLRDLQQNVERHKDARAPHWQALERTVHEEQAKLLEKLTDIDHTSVATGLAAFNATLLEFSSKLDSAEAKSVGKEKLTQSQELTAVNTNIRTLRERRETLRDGEFRLQEKMSSLQDSIDENTDDLKMYLKSKSGNKHSFQDIIVAKLRIMGKEMLALQAAQIMLHEKLRSTDLNVRALRAFREKLLGNNTIADRMRLKIQEDYGEKLAEIDPDLAILAHQSRITLSLIPEQYGGLTSFERKLHSGDPSALDEAIAKQRNVSIGTADLLDQHRAWGLGINTSKKKYEAKYPKPITSFPKLGSLRYNRLQSILNPESKFRVPIPTIRLGKGRDGETIVIHDGKAENERRYFLAFESRDGTVYLQDGTVIKDPKKIENRSIQLDVHSGWENVYLTEESKRVISKYRVGRRVVTTKRPREVDVIGWNAPRIKLFTSDSLRITSEHDGNFLVRDSQMNLEEIRPTDEIEKEQEEESRDVLRAIDHSPSIRYIMQAAGGIGSHLQSMQQLFAAGAEEGAEKSQQFVEYVQDHAQIVMAGLSDKNLQGHLEQAKIELQKLRTTNFGLVRGDLDRQIDERIDIIDGMIDMLDPTNPDGRSIRNMCESILDNSKFNADTWGNWCKHELPKFLAAIVVGTLVFVFAPQTIPFWASLALSVASGTVAYEYTAEATYWLNWAINEDIRSGRETYSSRSKVGTYLSKTFKDLHKNGVNIKTVKRAMVSLGRDVIGAYAYEFVKQYLITFATIGLGRMAAGQLSRWAMNTKVLQAAMKSGKLGEMRRFLQRIRVSWNEIQNNSQAKKAAWEVCQEIMEEGAEAGVQQAATKIEFDMGILHEKLKGIDCNLGFLAGTAIVALQGTRISKRSRGYNIDVPKNIDIDVAMNIHETQLLSKGQTVHREGKMLVITMHNGQEIETEFRHIDQEIGHAETVAKGMDIASQARTLLSQLDDPKNREERKKVLEELKNFFKSEEGQLLEGDDRIAVLESLAGRSLEEHERTAILNAHIKEGEIDNLKPGEAFAKKREMVSGFRADHQLGIDILDCGGVGLMTRLWNLRHEQVGLNRRPEVKTEEEMAEENAPDDSNQNENDDEWDEYGEWAEHTEGDEPAQGGGRDYMDDDPTATQSQDESPWSDEVVTEAERDRERTLVNEFGAATDPATVFEKYPDITATELCNVMNGRLGIWLKASQNPKAFIDAIHKHFEMSQIVDTDQSREMMKTELSGEQLAVENVIESSIHTAITELMKEAQDPSLRTGVDTSRATDQQRADRVARAFSLSKELDYIPNDYFGFSEHVMKCVPYFASYYPEQISEFLTRFGWTPNQDIAEKVLGWSNAYPHAMQALGKSDWLAEALKHPDGATRHKIFQDMAMKGIRKCFRSGDHDSAKKIADMKELCSMNDTDYEEAVQEGLLKMFDSPRDFSMERYLELQEKTGVHIAPKHPLARSAALRVLKSNIERIRGTVEINNAQKIQDYFQFTEQEFAKIQECAHDIAHEMIKDDLSKDKTSLIDPVCTLCRISQEQKKEWISAYITHYAGKRDMLSVKKMCQAVEEGKQMSPEEVTGMVMHNINQYLDSLGDLDTLTTDELKSVPEHLIALAEAASIQNHADYGALQQRIRPIALGLLKTTKIELYHRLTSTYGLGEYLKTTDNDVKEAAKLGVTRDCCNVTGTSGKGKRGKRKEEKLADEFDLTKEEFAKCQKNAALILAAEGNMKMLSRLEKNYDIKSVLSSEEGKLAAIEGVETRFEVIWNEKEWLDYNDNVKELAKFCKQFGITDRPELKAILKREVSNHLHTNSIDHIGPIELLDTAFDLSDTKNDAEIIQASTKLCMKQLASEKFAEADKVKGLMSISEEQFDKAKIGAIAQNLTQQYYGSALELTERFGLSENLSDYLPHIDTQGMLDIIALFDLKTIEELENCSEDPYTADFCKEYLKKNSPIKLTKNDLPIIKNMRISLIEAEYLKNHTFDKKEADLETIAKHPNPEYVITLLRSPNRLGESEWKDDQNIYDPFINGIHRFRKQGENARESGIPRMLKYLDRPGMSRHDGLHAFDKILDLHKASGLSSEDFYEQILMQVRQDGAVYSEGTAHDHLNALAGTLKTDFEETLAKAKQYDGIKQLQELVDSFSDTSEIFSSWNNLKRFAELSKILERAEGLEKLQEYRKKGKHKLCDFAETLAFHPDSQISIAEVMEFVENPENFLIHDDDHTPTEVHNRKKPSNYVNMPHLDLSAEQLRDALVEGQLDKLQAFRPLEVKYHVPKDGSKVLDLRESMRAALGKRENGKVVGNKSPNPKELFRQLNGTLKQNGLNLVKYLEGNEIDTKKREKVEEKLWDLVYNKGFGMPKPEMVTVIAKVNLKSSPVGILAGNDTACCMPFGSGKNNVYMFNLATSMFTLQVEDGKGRRRTIAQSLLTRDKDIKTNIAKVVGEMEKGKTSMTDIVSEDVLQESESYIGADNVEVAPNFQGGSWPDVIKHVYGDFFHEYAQLYGKTDNLNQEMVPVGLGYSDALRDLPKVDNTYAPEAPVSYSDKLHEEVYRLALEAQYPDDAKEITTHNRPDAHESPIPNIRGISALKHTDSLSIAYLEGKIYADNPSLMVYLHNLENGLIAKDINNQIHGRPEMSFKFTDANGRVCGYIDAYEGKLDKEYAPEAEGYHGKPVIYIADLAADTERSSRAGGMLIKAFMQQYQSQYIERGNLTPIYMEARDQTSYPIIRKQLERMSRETGMEIVMEEFGTDQVGSDTRHFVMITAKPRAEYAKELAAKAREEGNPDLLLDYIVKRKLDLDPEDRYRVAAALLGLEELNKQQAEALYTAHYKHPGIIGKLTEIQKKAKIRALRTDNVFTKDQAKLLLDSGLAGDIETIEVETETVPLLDRAPDIIQSALTSKEYTLELENIIKELREEGHGDRIKDLVRAEVRRAMRNPESNLFQNLMEHMEICKEFDRTYPIADEVNEAFVEEIQSPENKGIQLLNLNNEADRKAWSGFAKHPKFADKMQEEVGFFLTGHGLNADTVLDRWSQAWNNSSELMKEGGDKGKPYKEVMGTTVIQMQNIEKIAELESRAKGCTKALHTKWGISMFCRYPSEVLINQYKREQLPINKRGKTILFVNPAHDWNNAFNSEHVYWSMNLNMRDREHLVISESSTRYQSMKRVMDAEKTYGKIDTLVLGGHSDGRSIDLGDTVEDPNAEYSIDNFIIKDEQNETPEDKTRLKAYAKARNLSLDEARREHQEKQRQRLSRFRSYLTRNGKIILASCSSGVEGGVADHINQFVRIDAQGPLSPAHIVSIDPRTRETRYGSNGEDAKSRTYENPTISRSIGRRFLQYFRNRRQPRINQEIPVGPNAGPRETSNQVSSLNTLNSRIADGSLTYEQSLQSIQSQDTVDRICGEIIQDSGAEFRGELTPEQKRTIVSVHCYKQAMTRAFGVLRPEHEAQCLIMIRHGVDSNGTLLVQQKDLFGLNEETVAVDVMKIEEETSLECLFDSYKAFNNDNGGIDTYTALDRMMKNAIAESKRAGSRPSDGQKYSTSWEKISDDQQVSNLAKHLRGKRILVDIGGGIPRTPETGTTMQEIAKRSGIPWYVNQDRYLLTISDENVGHMTSDVSEELGIKQPEHMKANYCEGDLLQSLYALPDECDGLVLSLNGIDDIILRETPGSNTKKIHETIAELIYQKLPPGSVVMTCGSTASTYFEKLGLQLVQGYEKSDADVELWYKPTPEERLPDNCSDIDLSNPQEIQTYIQSNNPDTETQFRLAEAGLRASRLTGHLGEWSLHHYREAVKQAIEHKGNDNARREILEQAKVPDRIIDYLFESGVCGSNQ